MDLTDLRKKVMHSDVLEFHSKIANALELLKVKREELRAAKDEWRDLVSQAVLKKEEVNQFVIDYIYFSYEGDEEYLIYDYTVKEAGKSVYRFYKLYKYSDKCWKKELYFIGVSDFHEMFLGDYNSITNDIIIRPASAKEIKRIQRLLQQ